jgi:hypothetical protein
MIGSVPVAGMKKSDHVVTWSRGVVCSGAETVAITLPTSHISCRLDAALARERSGNRERELSF